MDLPALADALTEIQACNITAPRAGGFQVSILRRSDSQGWQVYSGSDLAETLARAVEHGPYTEAVDEDDWGGLV